MEEKKKYYAYMLECADGTIYSGFTTDPERRAAVHNSGTGARYTRSRLPVRLIYAMMKKGIMFMIFISKRPFEIET